MKIGFIGSSNISRFHIEAIRKNDFTIEAIGSTFNSNNCRELSESLNLKEKYCINGWEEVLNKEVSLSTPTMSLRTRKDIYSAAGILNISKNTVDSFLAEIQEGENFNKFIVIRDSKDVPQLTWVKIGVSDLSNV